jgi:hypothetical protein
MHATRRTFLAGLAQAALLGAGGCSSTSAATFQLDAHTVVRAQRLDQEVAAAFALFNVDGVLPGFDAATQGARRDVALYRLRTMVRIPETGESFEATGLLALPAGATGSLPVVSWQHGTILSFDQVPSNLTRLADLGYTLSDAADSLETLFNIHRFAASGYAVIAADYVGKGPLRNGRSEGYVVKGVTTATCLAMLEAGQAALRSLGVAPGALCLHGWSQGSLNTQWLHQALRGSGVAIAATAVASPFCDLEQAWSYWTGRTSYPLPAGASSYPDVPGWVALCMVLVLGSYERYYGIPGLLEDAIRPEFHQMARQYWNDYVYDAERMQSFPGPQGLLVPGFFAPGTAQANRLFMEHARRNSAAGWRYDSPIRFCIGLADEATHPDMTTPVIAANPGFAHGVLVAGANHRTTFLAGLYGGPGVLQGQPNALAWFDAVVA